MIKRLMAFIFLVTAVTLFAGCSTAVRSSLSDRWGQLRPYRIAILPVDWRGAGEEEEKDISYLFRRMSLEKLKAMNYGALPLEIVDEKYPKSGRTGVSGAVVETLKSLDADAALLIHVTEWNRDNFVTYASLKVAADFELYAANGTRLWRAEYETRESDLRLDRKSLQVALIKAYEPRVQRFVDAVFSTLPQGTPPVEKERFFQWLP